MTQFDQMHSGELYLPTEPDILYEQLNYQDLLFDFNHTRPSQRKKREELLKICLMNWEKMFISNLHLMQTGAVTFLKSAIMSTLITI
nr:maltose acetyltransferase domain-containing protein [Streptococcus parauberis]